MTTRERVPRKASPTSVAAILPLAGRGGVQCEGLGVTGRERVGSPGAVCGPRTEAHPLGVIRRHFLLQSRDGSSVTRSVL